MRVPVFYHILYEKVYKFVHALLYHWFCVWVYIGALQGLLKL